MAWWREKPMRLIQTNLREIDLPLDPRKYAVVLDEFGANVALFNLGGIVANYPTKLPFHFANPRLKEDLIPELIEQLHQRNIRLIGRFDFSKVNETIGSRHPEWLYRGLDGNPVPYNGQMQCCVNGSYQQDCSREILTEALGLYALDGVFFNMIGYQTTDYSGVYHGICQCDNCRRNFGEELPRQEDTANPVYLRYLRFCQVTGRNLFLNIRDTIRAVRPDCAICTYTNEGVDIIRSESNSGISRPQPEYVYESSLNVRRVLGSWPGLASSNAAVHFIDYPYRHAGVAPALTARRLAQNFIHGGWMDYYVIGKLDEQQDRACLPGVKRLYALHRQADAWLAGARPLADVCIVAVNRTSPGYQADEMKGIITLLSEAHILYDVIEEAALGQFTISAQDKRYRLIILPNMAHLPEPFAAFLDEYVAQGGKLLLTGTSGSVDGGGIHTGKLALECAGILRAEARQRTRGAYFALREGDPLALTDLEGVDWIPLDSPWLACSPAVGAKTWLQVVPVGMFGPPEKCYYTEAGTEPGLIVNQFGNGICAVIPWQIGTQQAHFPTHAIERLFRAVIERVLRVPRSIQIEAPALVEVAAFHQAGGKTMLVGLVNLSGQNGRMVHEPLPVENIRIGFAVNDHQIQVSSLVLGPLAWEKGTDGVGWVVLPRLNLVDMLRIQTE